VLKKRESSQRAKPLGDRGSYRLARELIEDALTGHKTTKKKRQRHNTGTVAKRDGTGGFRKESRLPGLEHTLW